MINGELRSGGNLTHAAKGIRGEELYTRDVDAEKRWIYTYYISYM